MGEAEEEASASSKQIDGEGAPLRKLERPPVSSSRLLLLLNDETQERINDGLVAGLLID